MFDDRFCQFSNATSKQRRYIAALAERAGFTATRDAVAKFAGVSSSKATKLVSTGRVNPSELIDWLKEQPGR